MSLPKKYNPNVPHKVWQSEGKSPRQFAGVLYPYLNRAIKNNTIVTVDTATYTLSKDDCYKLLDVTVACTITLADFIIEDGAQIDFVNTTAGTVTITAGAGVTLLSKAGTSFDFAAQYVGVTLIKLSASTWIAVGDIV